MQKVTFPRSAVPKSHVSVLCATAELGRTLGKAARKTGFEKNRPQGQLFLVPLAVGWVPRGVLGSPPGCGCLKQVCEGSGLGVGLGDTKETSGQNKQ